MSLRLLFFEETEDYIFYREQVVFLIFVSFFRCNFYLCSDPNLLVWVRDGWHCSVTPSLAGAQGALPGEPHQPARLSTHPAAGGEIWGPAVSTWLSVSLALAIM